MAKRKKGLVGWFNETRGVVGSEKRRLKLIKDKASDKIRSSKKKKR